VVVVKADVEVAVVVEMDTEVVVVVDDVQFLSEIVKVTGRVALI
jgi:hypothetical protein